MFIYRKEEKEKEQEKKSVFVGGQAGVSMVGWTYG